MTKAEKNYKRNYGHKDTEELALNYTRDGMKEELDTALSEVSSDELTSDEQESLNGRNQCHNHVFPIRFMIRIGSIYSEFRTGRNYSRSGKG